MTQRRPLTNTSIACRVMSAVVVGLCVFSSPLFAAEKGTNIIGSDESPTVLNIVPWKSKELTVDPWKTRKDPSTTILDHVVTPVDKDELQREVRYFNLLHSSDAKKSSKSQAATRNGNQ